MTIQTTSKYIKLAFPSSKGTQSNQFKYKHFKPPATPQKKNNNATHYLDLPSRSLEKNIFPKRYQTVRPKIKKNTRKSKPGKTQKLLLRLTARDTREASFSVNRFLCTTRSNNSPPCMHSSGCRRGNGAARWTLGWKTAQKWFNTVS